MFLSNINVGWTRNFESFEFIPITASISSLHIAGTAPYTIVTIITFQASILSATLSNNFLGAVPKSHAFGFERQHIGTSLPSHWHEISKELVNLTEEILAYSEFN